MSLNLIIHQLGALTRYSFKNPGFALQLLRARIDHLFHRKLTRTYIDPRGYGIDSPEKLFTWWALYIDRNLVHPAWTKALATAQSPEILDVGANAGVFTHLVLGLNPSARVTAVEPQPELVQLIRAYASRSKASIRCVEAACSDREGVMTLFLENVGDVRASLDPTFGKQNQQLKVSVTTVDAIAPAGDIFMLKIDAEGHDIEVLRGASGTLPRTRFVLIECHKPETFREATTLLAGWHCQKVGPYDFLFSRF
jgi:FkbM family methyltransferase